MFSRVVVYLDAEPASLHGLRYAAQLVMKPKGQLIGVFVNLPVNAYHENDLAGPFARGAGALALAQQVSEDMWQVHDSLLKTLARTAHDAGVTYEFRALPFAADLEVASQSARSTDLAVLRAPDGTHPERDPYGWSSTDLVLSAGVPLLLVPTHAPPQSSFERVVIGWNGAPEARRAVAAAMPILKSASDVALLIVDARLADEGNGVEPGTAIAMELADQGVRADLHLLESHHQEPGCAVVKRAEALAAQIVVMGAYGHSRLASMILGSTTHYVVGHAEIPIFLSH